MHKFEKPETFIGKSVVRWNLGCGERPMPGWINQDLYAGEGVDEVFDLNKPWPIDNASVDEYICLHTLEHLDDPIHFFREVQRTLKPDGLITIETPYGNSDAAMADPTHKRPYFLGTYGMFTYNQHDNFPTYNPQHHDGRFPYKFEFQEVSYIVDENIKKYPLWRKWAIPASRYLTNIVTAIRVTMRRVER